MKASLSPERWQQVQQLFDEIAESEPEDRAARLDEACRDDPALREEVESLLEAYEHADDLLGGLDRMAQRASQASGSLRAGTVISHYEIIEKLGGGGMGVVFKARDTRLKRIVALKFLPHSLTTRSEARLRFEQEAQAASALDHPNICTIHDTGQTDEGQLFIAMTYYEGETLKKKIARGPAPVDEALSYATQIARGLAKAHAKGIVHRDIKPANVMITDDDIVKIVDFGLAKMDDVALTRTGATLGTVAYMSPEQAHGGQVDAQTDVWSLGMVLYEMLTGERPFDGEHEQTIIYKLLNEEPASITEIDPALPEELDHVVTMCLEKEKDLRYSSMVDLLADLEVLTQSTGTSTHSFTVTRTSATERFRRRKRAKRWRKAAVAGGAALAVLVAMLAVASFRQPALPAERHLAVLPFFITEAVVDQAFADGLVATFRSMFSRLERTQDSLWVVPAREMREYSVESPEQARQFYGVTLAVLGRIEPAGERIRLALSLVDTKSGQTLRSSHLDGQDSRDAVFQVGLLTAVTDLLDLDLAPADRRSFNAGGTTQSEAFVFYQRGLGYLERYDQLDQIDLAIQLFEQALQEDSIYALAHAGLGEAYWRKFDITMETEWMVKAQTACERAAQLDTDLAPVYVTLGLIHTESGRYGSAKMAFNDALDREPGHAGAHRGLAKLYEEQGNQDEAEKTYQRAIALKTDFWGGYYDLGEFYRRTGRYTKAIEQFQHVVALTPDNFLGYSKVGTQYWYLKEPEKAKEWYEKSIAIKPNYAATKNLATLHYLDEEYEDAITLFNEALVMQDTDYRTWGYLANSYYWIDERNEARKAWQTMIEMAEPYLQFNPRNADVLSDLAGATSKIGDRDKALSYIERLLAVDRKDMSIYFDAAKYYEVLGERDQALQYLDEALKNGQSLLLVEETPWLEDLLTDPRYKKMKESYEAMRE